MLYISVKQGIDVGTFPTDFLNLDQVCLVDFYKSRQVYWQENLDL